ncbi:hypothetical protein ACFX15_037492 [Malus domestica]
MEGNHNSQKLHTLGQDNVKQNQSIVPTRASSIEGNHNSQKLHTLDEDSVKQNQFMVPTRASSMEGNYNSQTFEANSIYMVHPNLQLLPRCGLHHNLLLNSVKANFVYVVSPTFSNF